MTNAAVPAVPRNCQWKEDVSFQIKLNPYTMYMNLQLHISYIIPKNNEQINDKN